MLYYGSQFAISALNKSFNIESFALGVADFCGYTISNLLCPRLKRRIGIIISYGVTCICCLLCFFFKNSE